MGLNKKLKIGDIVIVTEEVDTLIRRGINKGDKIEITLVRNCKSAGIDSCCSKYCQLIKGILLKNNEYIEGGYGGCWGFNNRYILRKLNSQEKEILNIIGLREFVSEDMLTDKVGKKIINKVSL